MKTFLALLVCFSFFIPSAKSQTPGTIDNSFGVNGVAAGTLVPDFLQFGDVKIQDNGKILIMSRMKNGNDYDVVMMRVDSNGTLDNSFGTNGEEEILTPTVSEFPVCAAIQSDGKILAAGGAGQKAFVGRFNVDGTLDLNFGTNGWTYTAAPNSSYGDVYGLQVLPDGKIIAGGNSFGSADVFRLDENGKVDSTFGSNGHALVSGVSVFCMTVQPDGKILVGGRMSHCCVARLNADGSIDSGFGTNGIVETDINGELSWFQKIFFMPDEKLLCAGSAYTTNPLVIQYVTARYNSNGTIDNSYASNGFNVTSFSNYFILVPTAAVLQSDEKIVFTGEVAPNNGDFAHFMLVRMTSNGDIDQDFGTDGVAITAFGTTNYAYPFSIALQSSGKIIVAGRIDNNGPFVLAAVRYYSGINTGIPSFTSNVSNLILYPNPVSEDFNLTYSLQRNEKISIRLTDVVGRMIQEISNEEIQMAGEHTLATSFQEQIPSGIYFINITSGTSAQSVRLIKE